MNADDEPRGEVCRACGEEIPEYDVRAHAAGQDGNRPGCARQDLERLVVAGNPADAEWRRYVRGAS